MNHTIAKELFSYVCCLLFLFDLCYYDARYPAGRFIAYWSLLLLGFAYIRKVRIHGLRIFTNCTVKTVHRDISHQREIPKSLGQILLTPSPPGLMVLKGLTAGIIKVELHRITQTKLKSWQSSMCALGIKFHRFLNAADGSTLLWQSRQYKTPSLCSSLHHRKLGWVIWLYNVGTVMLLSQKRFTLLFVGNYQASLLFSYSCGMKFPRPTKCICCITEAVVCLSSSFLIV